MTKQQEDKIRAAITGIRNTRTANNLNWMMILELAIIHAPEEALEFLKGIHGCDASIQEQFTNLVTELEHVITEQKASIVERSIK
jgi:hypothetical protein